MTRKLIVIATLKRVLDDLIFTALMLGGMFVLFVFKPRYIKLVVKGYLRALRQGRAPR